MPTVWIELAATVSAAVIHELGHIIAMLLLGIKPNGGKFGVWGIRINVVSSKISYKKQVLVSISGSLANFITAFWGSERLRLASMAYGFFNLIPISALDGGEVLSSLMYICKASPDTVLRTLCITNRLFALILWVMGVYFALKFSASGLLLSAVYLVFAVFLYKKLD